MIENHFFKVVSAMLDERNSQIQLNIIQLISSLAEHPQVILSLKGRIQAQACKPKLNSIKQSDSQLAEYVDYTI